MCATCVNVSESTNKYKSHQTFTPKTAYEPKYTDKRQPNNNKMCLRNINWWACACAFAHLKRTNLCVCVLFIVLSSNAVNSIQINYHKKSYICAIILAHKRFQMDYLIEMRMDHIIQLLPQFNFVSKCMMDAYNVPFVFPLNHRSIWWNGRTYKPKYMYNNRNIPVKPIKSDSSRRRRRHSAICSIILFQCLFIGQIKWIRWFCSLWIWYTTEKKTIDAV